jgi:hypothetical protein
MSAEATKQSLIPVKSSLQSAYIMAYVSDCHIRLRRVRNDMLF